MRNNNWVFGYNCGLDFSNAPAAPTATSGHDIRTDEGCASISDKNGQLLFYTDGSTIWDGRPGSTNAPIQDLKGDKSSTQSAIIILDPASKNQYYIFTTEGSTTIGNRPLDHFAGGVLNVHSWTYTPLTGLPNHPKESPVEKITATAHQNCKGFWVVTMVQKGENDSMSGPAIMRIFLLDSNGLTHHSDIPLEQIVVDSGYMKFSPDGKKIGIVSVSRTQIHVYDFDNSTGTLDATAPLIVNTREATNYGLEFSPDSQLLYYADYSYGRIYQTSLTPPVNTTLVADLPGRGITGALQLGPDGRIYIARAGEQVLGAITAPNTLGTACAVDADFVKLAEGSTCQHGLPNLVPNFCPDEDSCEDCSGCNDRAEELNEELIERAKAKFNTQTEGADCHKPFEHHCEHNLATNDINREPCFSFHWGDSKRDQIEEHDTEIFYLTACNKFNDVRYEGLRIISLELLPKATPEKAITIVSDRLINIGCLAPCSCQTREFAMITRGTNIAGGYELNVEYCYDQIVIDDSQSSNTVSFKVEIVAD